MMIANLIAAAAALTLTIASVVAGQTNESIESQTAPPNLLVLVYQRFSLKELRLNGCGLAILPY